MSSGPNPAVLVFPSGVDSYSQKLNRSVVISGESNLIPAGSPYQFFLGHLPLQTSPSNVSIPGFTETSGVPASFGFNVTYSGSNSGLLIFNSAQATDAVNVTYTTAGDILQSEFINSLQTSVESIETYILANAATSGVVHMSGGTMTGNLVMSGSGTSSITTSVSGVNTLGSSGLPFGSAYISTLFGQGLQSDANNYVKFSGNVLKQKANTIRLEAGTDIYLTTSGSSIYLYGSNINVSGSIIPTFSGFYNLGSSSQHFGTIYVDNIVTPNGSGTFVSTSGGTMTGNLVMNNTSVVTDSINSNTGIININGSPVNINSTSNISLLPALGGQVDVANTLNISANLISNSASIIPASPNAYDLGASGSSFRAIYVDTINGASLQGSFVRSSGDSMTGDLTIQPPAAINVATINAVGGGGVTINAPQVSLNSASIIDLIVGGNSKLQIGAAQIYQNASIIPIASGTFDIGEASRTISTIYADNIQGGRMSDVIIENPSFSGTATLLSNTSIVSVSSGTVVIGSATYPIGTIYADNLVTSVTSGTYVSKYGDTMTGNLTLASGASILSTTSGTSNIGSASQPLGTVYANNFILPSGGGVFVSKTGDTMNGPLLLNNLATPSGNLLISGTNNVSVFGNSTINLTSAQSSITSTAGPIVINASTELQLLENGSTVFVANPSGAFFYGSISPNASGTLSVGTITRPFARIYADEIIQTSPPSSGTFVSKFGDAMSGNLVMASGASILTFASGVNNLGASGTPFAGIYVDSINGVHYSNPSGNFVHLTGDTMTGVLRNNQITNAGAAWITISGSVAEGINTVAFGLNSHAEGNGSQALGNYSHAENESYTDTGATASHAEGSANAYGQYSHAEGYSSTANGARSHSEGDTTTAGGDGSHAEGIGTTANGNYSHAEGDTSIASGYGSHAEGDHSLASGAYSHAENHYTIASGTYSHAEGEGSFAYGNDSHAEGFENTASGYASHAEGKLGTASGGFSHAEGDNPTAIGDASHAEGYHTIAGGQTSHAEGTSTQSVGQSSHAQGNGSIASGTTSFAAGTNANALHAYSVAFSDQHGVSTTATNQMTLGFANGVILTSGTSVNNTVSGINNLGSSTQPFNTIYTKNIFDNTIYMEQPSGSVNGINSIFTLNNSPISNSLMLHKNGLLMLPSGVHNATFDYTLSGNTLTYAGIPTSGSIHIAAQYKY